MKKKNAAWVGLLTTTPKRRKEKKYRRPKGLSTRPINPCEETNESMNRKKKKGCKQPGKNA